MSQIEVQEMIRELMRCVDDEGYTLLTWNGLGFDFPVLADESGLLAECQEFARNHVDMMFYILCIRGHRLGLDTAAKGMGLPGKTEGMTGADAPKLWADGQYEKFWDTWQMMFGLLWPWVKDASIRKDYGGRPREATRRKSALERDGVPWSKPYYCLNPILPG